MNPDTLLAMRPHTAFWSWIEPEQQQILVKSVENHGDRIVLTTETVPPWAGPIEDVRLSLPEQKGIPVRALDHSRPGQLTIEADGNLGVGDWFSLRLEPAWAVVELRED